MSCDGLVLVDKEEGFSSRKVDELVAKIYGERRAGHLGTLDPIATGLLPVMLGKATKLAPLLEEGTRLYRAKVKLGVGTDTMDREGKVISEKEVPSLSFNELKEILSRFVGEIEQVPPMYSALRYKGQRLYRLARKGLEVDRRPRRVSIYKLELLDFKGDEFEILVECERGTYLRVVAYDIGRAIDCPAHLLALRRLKAGHLSVESAVTLDILRKDKEKYLIPIADCFFWYPKLELDEKKIWELKDGKRLPVDKLKDCTVEEGKRYRVKASSFFIVAEAKREKNNLILAPIRVLEVS